MEPRLHDQLRKVTDICADDAEIFALSITRFLAAGYSTGDVACWDTAYAGAERVLGAAPGGRLVASLIGLIRAFRAERSGGWTFMPATCCRMTRDEEAMVGLLAAARRGEADRVRSLAADFIGAPAAPLTGPAVLLVAATLDEIAVAFSAMRAHQPGAASHLH